MERTQPQLAPRERVRQASAALALAAGCAYLGWRFGFTLRPGLLWLGVPLIASESWALLAAALFVFSTWRLTVREPGPPVAGRVAILVPTYNEPPEVLRATVLGSLSVRHRPTPEVWILDDGDRAWVKAMAEDLGVRYLVRPAPRHGAKAGNINHSLEHVDADFLLLLDADHVPFPHFLERTLGYFADPQVAFVQSPQAFFNRSFQHPRSSPDPIRNEQSLFYDVVCRGKDRDNAAFWCGSSAVVRREALLSVGGVATETVVEDTHTSMKMHQAGWRSVYHDEVVAVGLAPEEVRAFLTQRGRWARGCYQMLRKDNPLLARGLTLKQRLHYFSSVSHYLEGPQRLVGSIVPALVLLTGTVPLAADPRLYVMLFVPQVVLVPAATAALARGRYRFFESDRYALVRMGAYTAAAAALVQRTVSFKVTPKGPGSQSGSPVAALWLQVSLALLTVVAIGYQTVAQVAALPGRLGPFTYAWTILWCLLNAGLIGATAVWAAGVRHRRDIHRFPVKLKATYSTLEGAPELKRAVAFDLNPAGIGLQTLEQLPLGQPVRITLDLDGSPVELSGAVSSSRPSNGHWASGIRLHDLDQTTQDRITQWCFSQPFGPDHPVASRSVPLREELRESA